MNFIKYQIAATTENADLITAITKLMLEAGQADTPVTDAKAAPAKEVSKPAATKTAPTKEATKAKVEEAEEATSGATLTDLKDAIKAARAAHGEEFCKTVLIANGAADSTLGRMASAIAEDSYADTIAQLIAGPTTATADDLDEDDGLEDEEDDDLDDEADDSEVTVDAVKLAAKAYAKEVGRVEAKDIMNANGAAALSKIDDCTPAQLKAMFKAFTA